MGEMPAGAVRGIGRVSTFSCPELAGGGGGVIGRGARIVGPSSATPIDAQSNSIRPAIFQDMLFPLSTFC